jgi:hypothetical protein
MIVKTLSLGASLAALGLGLAVPPDAAAGSHAAAVKACSVANEHQPMSLITAIADGRGGSLVWLTDSDADLWLCSSDAKGLVYAYSLISGDMLDGAGANLAEPVKIGGDEDVPLPPHNPLVVAEKACKA